MFLLFIKGAFSSFDCWLPDIKKSTSLISNMNVLMYKFRQLKLVSLFDIH